MRENALQSTTLHSRDVVIGAHVHNGHVKAHAQNCDVNAQSLICDKCRNSKLVIFQEKLLKVLKCYNFLWVQRRHNCSPAASFTNCVMKLYLLKVHLQTFLFIPVTKKCQILSCDTLVANERIADRSPAEWASKLSYLNEKWNDSTSFRTITRYQIS